MSEANVPAAMIYDEDGNVPHIEKRVLVCGSRDWTDTDILYTVMRGLRDYSHQPLVIIEGDAKGADKIAGMFADSDITIEHLKFPANWVKYGKAAGPIRNQQMLDEGQPDIVYAFHSDLYGSKGTKDMVNRAVKEGLPVYVVSQYNG